MTGTERAKPAHVDELDGLRAIAVLTVLVFHTRFALAYGWLGVELFFVLSGYLITGILLHARSAMDRRGGWWDGYAKPFYIRRTLRIFPLAYAALLVVFVVLPALGWRPAVPFGQQVWYWLYLNNWYIWSAYIPIAGMGHFWSLAVEEQFYLCWPWVVLLAPRKQLTRIALALATMPMLLRLLLVIVPVFPDKMRGPDTVRITPLRMDGLMVGVLLALLAYEGLHRWKLHARWVAVIVGALFVVLTRVPGTSLAFVLITPAFTVTVAAMLLLILTSRDSVVCGLLRTRWLCAIGKISYGIYVVHLPIIAVFQQRGWPPARILAVSLPASLLLATVSWYLLESPFLRLKERWAS